MQTAGAGGVCRACLAPLSSRKYHHLYSAPAHPRASHLQLATKIMACAWVQVFDGDGLPSHICSKCHDTLEIAYQFKQLCESSDNQLKQFFGRNLSNKSNSLDCAPEPRDCTSDYKPINFNFSNERLELPQCEFSLNTLRLLNQDMPFMQNLQLNIPEQTCDTKEEPGYSINPNNGMFDRSEQCSVFKSGSCMDGESFLSTIQAKLLEAVSESLSNALPSEINDNRMIAWDLQNKQPLLPIPEKTIGNELNSIGQKIPEEVGREDTLSFLDERMLTLDRNICSELENVLIPKVENASKEKECPSEAGDAVAGSPVHTPVNEQVESDLKRKETKKSTVKEQCEQCGKVFKCRGYMQLHMRTHTEERPFSCKFCKQTFALRHILVAHLRTHSGDKPYVCAECGKAFSQASGLKSHMRTHNGEKPFQCEICQQSFAQSSNLKSHKLIHSGRRDHVCKICNKAFKFSKHLRGHQKTHTDQKEFKCTLCPKSFITKSYLKTHMSIHCGLKRFRCGECGQAFVSSTNLRTHLRVHSGLKPFACQFCKKTFTQSNGMKRHMKQHRLLTAPQHPVI